MTSVEPTESAVDSSRRTARRFAFGVVLALIVLNVFFVRAVLRDPRPARPDEVVAERFFDGLVAGNGAADPKDSESRTGYDAAWDMVAERTVDYLGFDHFLEEQQSLVDELGFLDTVKKLDTEDGDFRRRTLEYRMMFSGTRGRPREALCRITLVHDEGDYVVERWTITPKEEDR